MVTKRTVSAISIALLALLVGGCSSSDSKTTEAPTAGQGNSNEGSVHLYTVNATTGQSASQGLDAIREQQLLVDHVNDQGGLEDSCGNVWNVDLTVWDMANSREQAIAGIRAAAGDPSVLAVLGPSPDVGNLPMIPVAGELSMPYIIASSGAKVENWNPYSFRVQSSADLVIPSAIAEIQKSVGLESMAILYDATQDAQSFYAEVLQDNAAEAGYKVTTVEAIQGGDVDFKSQLTRIKSTDPEWIVITTVVPEFVSIVNQMDELNMDQRILVSDAQSLFPEAWEGTDGKVEGVYFWSPGGVVGSDIELNEPLAKSLFEDAYGELPSIWGVIGWDAAAIALEGVVQTCSPDDREALRAALGKLSDFPSAAFGEINFQNPPSGDNQTPVGAVGITTGSGQFDLLQ